MKTQNHRFPRSLLAVLCVSIGILILTTSFALMRRSGNTGLDMSKVQEMRREFARASE